MEINGMFIPALLKALGEFVDSGYHYTDVRLVFDDKNEVLHVKTVNKDHEADETIATVGY